MNKRFGGFILWGTLLVVMIVSPLLFPTAALAATCTWNGTTGNWSEAARWGCGHAPGASDTAIINSGAVTVDTAVTVQNLTLTGGTLQGSNNITITGAMVWTGGYQSGTGATNIAAGATLTLNDSTDYLRQHGRTINNAGTATWSSSSGYYWYMQDGAVFNNQAGATFNAQANDQLGVSGSGTFNNLGTFTRSGTGTSRLDVSFNNSSPTQVTGGTLNLNAGGTSSGAFEVGDTAGLQFGGGTYNLNTGATLTGAGIYRLSGGTLSINGAVSVTNFEQTGATFTGAGTLTVSGIMTWSGGYQTGAGTTDIAATGRLYLNDSTDYLRQHGRTLNNAGTATWTSSSGYYWYLEGGAVFNNQAGATFNAQANDQLGVSGSGTFNNLGTFTRSGTGTSRLDVSFNNSSPTQVTGGTLNLNAGGTSSGAFEVGDTAGLQFGGGTYNLNTGATLTGAGIYRLSGGTLSINGAVSVTNFEQTGATFTGNGTFTVSGTMTWTGGYQSGTGATNIAAGATLTLNDSTDYLRQHGRTLNNAGTATWTSSSGYYWYLEGGAVFNNQAGATFNAQANDQLGVSGSGTFNNLGTFTRSGAGTSTIQVPFNNSSPTQVTKGVLLLNAGGTSGGAFQVSAGATLQFGGGTYSLNPGATLSGAGLYGLFNGTVSVSGTVSVTNFEQTGGTLTGAGTFSITSTMDWIGGYQSGTGATNIAAAATLTLNDSTDYLRQHGRTLNNAGTATWTSSSGYYWYLEGGAVFNNQAGATFNAQANDQLGVSGSGTFNNLGTFTRSGVGTSTIQVPFNNSSPTQVVSGTLNLNAGGASGGAFQVSAGAILQFNGGTYNLNPGATLSGAGLYRLSGGTLSVNGAVPVTNFEQTAATLTGSGTLAVSQSMAWTGGAQSGTGATNIAAGATLKLNDTGGYLDQNGRTLNNAGTTDWTTGGGYYWYMQGGAVFNNQAGATFNAQANEQLGVGGGGGTFNNLGTFTRSGAGTSTIQVAFTNNSPTQVMSGTLNLNGGGSSSGAFQVSAGATLQFGGGTHTLAAGSSVTGAGDVTFSGGTVTVNGSYNIPGVTTVSGGTVNLDGATGVVLATFTQTGGTLNLGDASISRNFARTGGTFNHTGTLTFNGADVQGLTLNQATTFNNLTVNAGVILDESVAANNATVAGQLTNLGIIRKTLAIAGPGSRTFGLTEATLNVVVPDQLSSVQVDRRDTNHPNATISQAYGRYWTITPTGGGYTVDVTLPHRNVYHAQAQACRYTGASWDCGRTSSTATTVTRAGVTTLSDWVVGYPPAAVSLAKSAVSNPAPAGSPFTYRFAITNTGPVTATTVVLTDTLPAALKHGLAGNVLMLHLDEPVAATTFQDVSGQGNNGTCTGIACPTAGVSGKFGKAAQFDGVNDVISAGNPAVLRLTGALSLAGWFKTTAPVGNYRALVSKWHTGPTNASYLLGWETGGLRFCLSNGTRMICANSGQAYNNGQWHHVAGTWNGTTATIYVDGAAVNATPDGTFGLVANTTLNVKVGSDDSGSGDRFFNGQIDEVAIYRHALSAAEITAIYQAGIRGWLTTGQGVCAINGELRCDLGEIAAAKTTTVTLQLVAEAATDTVANHACVRAYENDANLNDNCAAATVWFLKRKLYLPIMLRSQ